MKKSILFIVNPFSGPGGKRKEYISSLIKKYLDQNIFEWELIFTKYAGHASEISKKYRDQYDFIVAVGGDGTINEVAQPLVNSSTALGIIPGGSGNGLARFLKIPRNKIKAIKLLNRQCITKIDTIALSEGHTFLNVAGTGFDAHVAKMFAHSKKRGFVSYALIAFREVRRFKPAGYKLTIDGSEKIEHAPFLVSIANSSQYGNSAHIAPQALITDGLMDVCVLRKVPFWYYPVFIIRLFSRTLHKSQYYQCWQGREVIVNFLDGKQDKQLHMDGDHFDVHEQIKFTINPLSLKVMCLPPH